MRRCQCCPTCPRFITSRAVSAKYHPLCRAFAAKVRAALTKVKVNDARRS